MLYAFFTVESLMMVKDFPTQICTIAIDKYNEDPHISYDIFAKTWLLEHVQRDPNDTIQRVKSLSTQWVEQYMNLQINEIKLYQTLEYVPLSSVTVGAYTRV